MQLKRDMQSLGILKKNNTVHFNQVDTLVQKVLKIETEIQQTML